MIASIQQQWNSIIHRIFNLSLKQIISYTVTSVLLLASSLLWFVKPSRGIDDYVKLNRSFHLWQNGKNEEFSNLEKLMGKHREVFASYGGKIVQREVILNQKPSMELKGITTNFFDGFTKVTLLINDKNYSEALDKSEILQEEIIANGYETSFLSVYNLFRQASLAHQLALRDKELQLLSKLKTLSNETGFKELKSEIDHGDFTLEQYLSQREMLLPQG